MILASPIAGVITELAAREGMTVAAGATMFRINGVGTVWANAEVPESQAALVRPGVKVEARSPAIPDATFTGAFRRCCRKSIQAHARSRRGSSSPIRKVASPPACSSTLRSQTKQRARRCSCPAKR